VPDSELVYGPAAASFDSISFIRNAGGQLNRYSEEIGGGTYYGPQTLERIAREYSVNPRILLAVLEYQSGWVTGSNPDEILETYPLRYANAFRKGLFRQLSWAANTMNYGYYLWRVNALPSFVLADGSVVPANPTTNAGTVGVQYLMSELYGYDDWLRATGESGIQAPTPGYSAIPSMMRSSLCCRPTWRSQRCSYLLRWVTSGPFLVDRTVVGAMVRVGLH
jgi:LasA protease